MKNYKVIEIIDDKTLLINYGIEHGAKSGDKLRISDIGENIFDLDQSELGTLDAIKDTVLVDIPYESFSLCRKIKYMEMPILNPLSDLILKSKKIESLNIDKTAVTHRSIPDPTPIKVGDKAIVLP
jgi:hypothetical protein